LVACLEAKIVGEKVSSIAFGAKVDTRARRAFGMAFFAPKLIRDQEIPFFTFLNAFLMVWVSEIPLRARNLAFIFLKQVSIFA
jgi:hypothetical protein